MKTKRTKIRIETRRVTVIHASTRVALPDARPAIEEVPIQLEQPESKKTGFVDDPSSEPGNVQRSGVARLRGD